MPSMCPRRCVYCALALSTIEKTGDASTSLRMTFSATTIGATRRSYPRAYCEEACVKVGQTFLSARLDVVLPAWRQKQGLCRFDTANTRGVRSGFCRDFRDGADKARILFLWCTARLPEASSRNGPVTPVSRGVSERGMNGLGLMYVSRQECPLHPVKLRFPASKAAA